MEQTPSSCCCDCELLDGASGPRHARQTFEGVPVGAFKGRQAIAAAYAARPPDDQLILLEVLGRGTESIDVSYAWSKAPDTRAGTITVERLDDLISRLTVRFE